MRVAIHTQHFAGIGHHVRATILARTLRQLGNGGHEVLVFDGGRPFPDGPGEDADEAGRVQLPPVAWDTSGLRSCDREQPLAAVLALRRRLFLAGLRRLRPDVLLLDSFPFSRWALRDEVLAGIKVARKANRGVRVVCSLRDIPRASQRELPQVDGSTAGTMRTWAVRPGDDGLDAVPAVLAANFDGILVHGDPRIARLEEQYPWVAGLGIPVHYTGYVRQEAGGALPALADVGSGPLVVVSVGGGVNGLELIHLATAAWGELRRQAGWSAARMLVFGGALMGAAELAAAAAACLRHGADFLPFTRDFPAWLRTADLSISRGGYNTVVALLAARVRAIVLPGTDVSDQTLRTRRLAEQGIVSTGMDAALNPVALAALINRALGQPPPVHQLELDGAERTARLLATLPQRWATGALPA